MTSPTQRRVRPRWAMAGVAAVLLGAAVFALAGRESGGEPGLPDDSDAPNAFGARVRVEVRNAGGRSGAAREATRKLRDAGFDVVWWGNAAEFGRDTSVVLARLGDLDSAGSVAEALGIKVVREERDTTLFVDVTVLLGKGWGAGTTQDGDDGEKGRQER